ncbi:MAG: hypothetical protein HY785_11605 [Oscillatoriophycideae cyanobacterium NC_groundwater_1537_Pr4_S-0.65um_50_18]|nr:hypothetical protein [Oscillatoriophycideae cyanobacterium NC_groundwater_1537_Pr4_S-0.65um_50_18]
MNTAKFQGELEALGQRLQEALLKRSPLLQLQVRCGIRQEIVLILVEHLLHIEPDPEQTFAEIKRLLTEVAPDLFRSGLVQYATGQTQFLPVRAYLRIVGYQEPYQSQAFTLEPSAPVAKPVEPSVVRPSVRPAALPPPVPVILSPHPIAAAPVAEPEVTEAPEFVEEQAAASVEPLEAEPIAEGISGEGISEEDISGEIATQPEPVAEADFSDVTPDPEEAVAFEPEAPISEALVTEETTIAEDELPQLETLPEGWAEVLKAEIYDPIALEETIIIPEQVAPEVAAPEIFEPAPESSEPGAIAPESSETEVPEIEELEASEVEPEISEPESIAPQVFEPEVPEIEEPEAIAPQVFEPEVLEISEPEAIAPEISEPEISEVEPEVPEPEISEPEAIAPEIFEPEVSNFELEISEPEAIAPQVFEPEVPEIEPEISEPESSEPKAIAPEISEPEVPEISEPEAIAPEISEPEVPEIEELEAIAPQVFEPEVPEISEPEAIAPQVFEPEVSNFEPEISEPEAIAPQVFEPEVPEISKPEAIAPQVFEPEVPEISEPEVPEIEEPEAIAPEIFEPEASEVEPEIEEPEAIAPEVFEPEIYEVEPEIYESAEPAIEISELETGEPKAQISEPEILIAEIGAAETASVLEPHDEVTDYPSPSEEVSDLQSLSELSDVEGIQVDRDDSMALIQPSEIAEPEPVPSEAIAPNISALATPTPEKVEPQSEISTPTLKPLEGELPGAQASSPATSNAVPGDSQPPRSRTGFTLSTLMLGGAVGLFGLVTGAYVLSRPCVLGSVCEPIQKAQQLDQQATQTIATTDSALAVVEAYDQLTEANYLLGTIPSWSGQHQAAQALQATYENKSKMLGQVVKALKQGNAAAQKSQNPPHPLPKWRQIQWDWREAIALLEKVPPDSPVLSLAQKKLAEYKVNLDTTDRRVLVEQGAQDKVTTARKTAEVAENRANLATTPESWQQVYLTWEAAINLLQQVPQGTMAHAEAAQFISLYQSKMAEADNRRNQEQASTGSYQEAVKLAEQARNWERQNQWTQAVAAWRSAFTNIQQISQGTTYYSQAQPLVSEYQAALTQAETNLDRTSAMQRVKPDLDRACLGTELGANLEANLKSQAGMSKVCTYTLSPTAIRIQVTPQYDQAVENVITRAQTQGDARARAEVTTQVNELLRNLADIGKTAQVPIELYSSNGSMFANYNPNASGYVAR